MYLDFPSVRLLPAALPAGIEYSRQTRRRPSPAQLIPYDGPGLTIRVYFILLCWESLNVRCHRRLVAEWLEEKLGIVVPELGHERSESIPFNKQPSKWDVKPSQGTQSLRLF